MPTTVIIVHNIRSGGGLHHQILVLRIAIFVIFKRVSSTHAVPRFVGDSNGSLQLDQVKNTPVRECPAKVAKVTR
jgi:hypothetical protein